MTTSKGTTDPRGGNESPSGGAPGLIPLTREGEIAAWRRTMKVWAILLLVGGVLLLMGGSIWIGKTNSEGGFWVGSFGVLAIVLGAFCGRLAAAGPLPKRFTQEGKP